MSYAIEIVKTFCLRFFWNTVILFTGEDGIPLHLYPWQEEELELFLKKCDEDWQKVLDNDHDSQYNVYTIKGHQP